MKDLVIDAIEHLQLAIHTNAVITVGGRESITTRKR